MNIEIHRRFEVKFGIVDARIYADPDISPAAKAVYGLLATYAGQERQLWPSKATLARQMGMDRRTLDRALGQLEAENVLQVYESWTETGRQTSNRYVLNDLGPTYCRDIPPGGTKNDPPGGGKNVPPPPQKMPPLEQDQLTGPQEPGIDAPQAPDSLPLDLPGLLEGDSLPARTRDTRTSEDAQLEKDFDLFWSVYPKKASKLAARRAYVTARKRADSDVIHMAAVHYATQRAGKDPNFTKHPSTWLNGGCWMDEADQAAVGAANGHQPYQDEDYWSSNE